MKMPSFVCFGYYSISVHHYLVFVPARTDYIPRFSPVVRYAIESERGRGHVAFGHRLCKPKPVAVGLRVYHVRPRVRQVGRGVAAVAVTEVVLPRVNST